MSDLDTIAIRVVRNGKTISAFVSELEFLFTSELESLSSNVCGPILAALQTSPAWTYDLFNEVWNRTLQELDEKALDAAVRAAFALEHRAVQGWTFEKEAADPALRDYWIASTRAAITAYLSALPPCELLGEALEALEHVTAELESALRAVGIPEGILATHNARAVIKKATGS